MLSIKRMQSPSSSQWFYEPSWMAGGWRQETKANTQHKLLMTNELLGEDVICFFSIPTTEKRGQLKSNLLAPNENRMMWLRYRLWNQPAWDWISALPFSKRVMSSWGESYLTSLGFSFLSCINGDSNGGPSPRAVRFKWRNSCQVFRTVLGTQEAVNTRLLLSLAVLIGLESMGRWTWNIQLIPEDWDDKCALQTCSLNYHVYMTSLKAKK